MREIKFRAWEKTSESMVYDVQNVSRKRIIGESACESFQEVLDSWEYEIMQYTGLKDKNGVDIYGNGYILKVQSPKGPFLAKVIYELGTYGLIALNGKFVDYFPDHWNDHFIPLLDIYWNNNDDDQVIESVEIVGNIYENPELLEEITK